jgi:hypothetical protein
MEVTACAMELSFMASLIKMEILMAQLISGDLHKINGLPMMPIRQATLLVLQAHLRKPTHYLALISNASVMKAGDKSMVEVSHGSKNTGEESDGNMKLSKGDIWLTKNLKE